jgi:hypothetical protein
MPHATDQRLDVVVSGHRDRRRRELHARENADPGELRWVGEAAYNDATLGR